MSNAGRLSMLQAAFVIARRDFLAILFSRAFFFFLLGPLFPVFVGGLAGSIGQQVEDTTAAPQIGIAMQADDLDAMLAARGNLARELGPTMPVMVELARLEEGQTYDAQAELTRRVGSLAAIVTGTPANPELTATPERLVYWRGPVSLVAATAMRSAPTVFPDVTLTEVRTSGASETRARLRTAQVGQLILFLLIMLLAGMVLSNLVEEKGNKVIEILAAAIPMDAVFLGKLFAMLAVSMVGIAVWGTVIGGLVAYAGIEGQNLGPIDLANLPAPGVGWIAFFLLGIVYFAMGYLLLGSVFLAIGSLASTVREVQTLSMPVTMLQVLLFFFATYAMSQTGRPVEWAAMAFPFSSPFIMLARAAQYDGLWPHLLAVAWQLVWVFIFVRFGAALFRKRVMKSGPQGTGRNRGLRTMLAGLFRNSSDRTA
ncbi:ABC-2 type transport system permease protein [Altererythrobacter atlanticus]|uniref:ABC-2 family transporter protein n=1 Tax=Croceibacterium atlanticum TaxID=1267766 RepID=A0A0F7KWK6_9SPHN|nr:ABC transporter permease [Croceibacterium atlanticum]AKH43175.1 ABC-2 family transporter protein [Croceibacterium atlanticum]MBB5732120.1 ABC-2 type transport system permease protein [Croceibacterium atlanticum]